MALSLKEKNLPALSAFMVGHLAALAAATSIRIQGADSLPFESLLTGGAAVALGVVLVGLLNAQLDAGTKARLVYLRWRDPLPGGEAFTRWIDSDHRIDRAALVARFGPFPADRGEQGRLFYKLYKTVAEQPQVVDANKEFLFYRDAAVLGLFVSVLFGAVALAVDASWAARAVYWSGLLVAEALFVRAARKSGVRLVRNTLAALTED
jgi:hypothetical protein